MKRFLVGTLITAPILAFAQASPISYELKLSGITGGSTATGYVGWSDVGSFSWDISSLVSTTSTGKATFSDFSWTQAIDQSIPPLFIDVATGKRISTSTFDVLRSGTEFFELDFLEAVADNVDVVGSGGVPTVNAAIGGYTEVTMSYRPQRADGSYGPAVIGSFSVSKNAVEGEPNVTFTGDPTVLNGLFESGGVLAAVPEPGTWALTGIGIAALLSMSKRKASRSL